ncbi:hypothetical protein NP206_23775, partial [Salmonella enterica]|nr:hypothetical protein [Salmonella enterica]MCQ7738077.1 hypothetical protein [Salmonella enterica]MCQ7742765.1 hypothetical protein [Salmonella enterica]
MGVVRVPYLLAELKERGCADESALAQVMQPGCRIGEEDLRKLAANLGLEVSELAPAPENAANTRFKAKLRGGLASFLWHCCKVSDEAAFCLIQRPYISKTLLT